MSDERCPYAPPDREVRKAARQTAEALGDWAMWGSEVQRPTVADCLDTNEGADLKAERYSVGGGWLKLALPYIIEGDGPEARLQQYTIQTPDPNLRSPYAITRHNIEATFNQGWQRFIAAAPPDELQNLRDKYDSLLYRDPSHKATGIPIGEKSLKKGVELGREMSYYALMVGLARGKHAELATAPDDVMLQVARDLMPTMARRGRLPLRFVFWGRLEYTKIDYDQLYFEQNQSTGTWRIRSHDNLFDPYDPTTDPAPMGTTIGCMADLIKIHPTDKYSGMENAIWASINILHESGLFNPGTACEAWQLHRKIDTEAAAREASLKQTIPPGEKLDAALTKVSIWRDQELAKII